MSRRRKLAISLMAPLDATALCHRSFTHEKEKCCWSNLRPLTRRISSNTTTFSSSCPDPFTPGPPKWAGTSDGGWLCVFFFWGFCVFFLFRYSSKGESHASYSFLYSSQYTLHVYNLQVQTTDPLSLDSEIIAASSSARVLFFSPRFFPVS